MRGKKHLVEQRYGGDLREILIGLFDKHGSCQAVADELEVSYVTIRNWMSDAGLELVTRAVPASPRIVSPNQYRQASAMLPLFDQMFQSNGD